MDYNNSYAWSTDWDPDRAVARFRERQQAKDAEEKEHAEAREELIAANKDLAAGNEAMAKALAEAAPMLEIIRQTLATGKFPDGTELTPAQRSELEGKLAQLHEMAVRYQRAMARSQQVHDDYDAALARATAEGQQVPDSLGDVMAAEGITPVHGAAIPDNPLGIGSTPPPVTGTVVPAGKPGIPPAAGKPAKFSQRTWNWLAGAMCSIITGIMVVICGISANGEAAQNYDGMTPGAPAILIGIALIAVPLLVIMIAANAARVSNGGAWPTSVGRFFRPSSLSWIAVGTSILLGIIFWIAQANTHPLTSGGPSDLAFGV